MKKRNGWLKNEVRGTQKFTTFSVWADCKVTLSPFVFELFCQLYLSAFVVTDYGRVLKALHCENDNTITLTEF